jgi:hypothetical protein
MCSLASIIVDRFDFPGLLPVAIMASLAARHLPVRSAAIMALVLALVGVGLCLQSTDNDNPKVGIGPPPLVPQRTLTPPAMPPGQEAYINRTRIEVRNNPTDEANLRPRYESLQTWIRSLLVRGYPVNRVLPPEIPLRMASSNCPPKCANSRSKFYYIFATMADTD